jgi:hypothetical protein
VAEHFQTIVRHKSAPLRLILERGRERGEIGKDVDLDLAQAVLSGGLFYRRLVTHQRTSNRQVEAIVDTVLDGLTV